VVEFARIVIIIFSNLVLAGGIIGFVRAKSRPSLIAGVVSSLLLDLSFGLTFHDPKLGLIVGDALAFLLFLFGTIRFRKSRKFMPGGLLQMLSALTLIAVTLALVKM